MEELKRPEYYTEEEAPNPKGNLDMAFVAVRPYLEKVLVGDMYRLVVKKDAPPLAHQIWEDTAYWAEKTREYRAKGGAY